LSAAEFKQRQLSADIVEHCYKQCSVSGLQSQLPPGVVAGAGVMNLDTICVSKYAACTLSGDNVITKAVLLEMVDSKDKVDAAVLKLQQDLRRAEESEREIEDIVMSVARMLDARSVSTASPLHGLLDVHELDRLRDEVAPNTILGKLVQRAIDSSVSGTRSAELHPDLVSSETW
jgi:hypothetical protein